MYKPISSEYLKFVGTNQRTWLDLENKRVGRIFSEKQIKDIEKIHILMHTLRDFNLPVEKLLATQMSYGNHYICYYEYENLPKEDFADDGWYSPRINEKRLIEGAKALAKFHNISRQLIGPKKSLDHPYSNTLQWMYHDRPMYALMGDFYVSMSNEACPILNEFEIYIDDQIKKVKLHLKQLDWGLCHGDYHASNVIYHKDDLKLIVDYGFWIHHPIMFDLAIALELWSIDYDAPSYALKTEEFRIFINAYESIYKEDVERQVLIDLLPIARLHVACHRIQSYEYPRDKAVFQKYLKEDLLEKFKWCQRELPHLLKNI